MSREDEIKNAKPGDHLVYGTPEIRTLKNRKDGDDGWWFDDGCGLADHAYVNGFWLLLEQTPAFEAGRAAVLEEIRPLLESLVDSGECWFDHHGGCQGHGEKCPQQELKDLLAAASDV